MKERLYHWVRESKKKGCKSCCLYCEYYSICKNDHSTTRKKVKSMNEQLAIKVLHEHFSHQEHQSKKERRAKQSAYIALQNQKWLRDQLKAFEKNPSPENATRLVSNIYKVFLWNWR